MRVTANTFPNSLLDQLNSLTARQNRLQTQAATGQLIRLPEDDPVAMRRILDLQGEGKAVGQFQRNVARHQELANDSYEAIKTLKRISDRARVIATLADDIDSDDGLVPYSKEVSELIRQAAQAMNGKNRGDYLFSGTKTDTPAYALVADGNGFVTSVTYQGNTNQAESEIAEGAAFTVQAVGENTSGAGPRGLITDTRVGADFFNHLISLQNHLAAGDSDAIAATDQTALAQDEDNLLFHLGSNAALQARLEATRAIGAQRSDALEGLISKDADADLAQTLVRLNQTQTAYQAALQSGGKILNSSLLDYLR